MFVFVHITLATHQYVFDYVFIVFVLNAVLNTIFKRFSCYPSLCPQQRPSNYISAFFSVDSLMLWPHRIVTVSVCMHCVRLCAGCDYASIAHVFCIRGAAGLGARSVLNSSKHRPCLGNPSVLNSSRGINFRRQVLSSSTQQTTTMVRQPEREN